MLKIVMLTKPNKTSHNSYPETSFSFSFTSFSPAFHQFPGLLDQVLGPLFPRPRGDATEDLSRQRPAFHAAELTHFHLLEDQEI